MKRKTLSAIALLITAMLVITLLPTGVFAAKGTAKRSEVAGTMNLFNDPMVGEMHKKEYERFVKAANAPKPTKYNENDVARVRDFMEQETDGIKNGFWFNENYDPDDPSTFVGDAAGYEAGAIFSESGRLEELFFLFVPVQGNLDVTGCKMLTSAILYSCDLSSVVVDGCTMLESLDISYNEKITELDVSTCEGLVALTVQSNSGLSSLDLSGLANITELYMSETPFEELVLDGCTAIQILSVSLTTFEELDLSSLTELSYLFLNNTCLSEIDMSELTNIVMFTASGGETVKRIAFPKNNGDGLELLAEGNGGVGYYMYMDDNVSSGGAGNIQPARDVADGEYCICAYPSFGAAFLGWYDGDTLVSTDRRVATTFETDTRTLTAKFEGGVPMTTGSAADIHFMRSYLNYYTYVGAELWKHGYYLNNSYDSEDFMTFANVTFNENNRISAIDYSGKMLQGPIVLHYPELESFNMNGSNVSGITCIDCDSLTEIYANNSNIVLRLALEGAPNLRVLEVSNLTWNGTERVSKLDLSENHKIERLLAANGVFDEIIIDAASFEGKVELKADGGYVGCTYLNGVMIASAYTISDPFAGWYDENGNAVSTDVQYNIDRAGSFTAVFGDAPITVVGDVNGDGEVKVDDAVLIMRHALALALLDENVLPAADVNGDGDVTVGDAVLALRMALGLIND